jgi:hypothetical protein
MQVSHDKLAEALHQLLLVLEARVGRNEEADPRALVSDMRRYGVSQ